MLSRNRTPNDYSRRKEHTLSAAGTRFVARSTVGNSNGNILTKTAPQVLETHHPRPRQRSANASSKPESLFRDLRDAKHDQHRRLKQYAGPEQEAINRVIYPQSLCSSLVSNNTPILQCGNSTSGSSHACFAYANASGKQVDPTSEDNDKQHASRRWRSVRDCDLGARLSAVAGQTPRRARGDKPAAGRAFVYFHLAREEEVGKSVPVEKQDVYALDGFQSQDEDQQRGKKDQGGGLSVKDRIAALEAKKKEIAPALEHRPGVKTVLTGDAKSTTPVVYPLHYKRFVRRTSSAAPFKPDTPVHRSHRDEEAVLHAPQPTRSVPTLKSPSATHTSQGLRADRRNTDSIEHHVPFAIAGRHNEKRKKYVASPPQDDGNNHISIASYLHGTREKCIRHGRNSQASAHAVSSPQPFNARSVIAKSRSGAYIPTGLMKMRQMDATSPWVVPNQLLTSKTGSSKSGTETCPDCVAELGIKRREARYGIDETKERSVDHDEPFSGASTSVRHKRSSRAHPYKQRPRHGGSGDEGLVTSRNLGQGLSAIVIEHKGNLRRVVLNSQRRQNVHETMQKLSHELAMVAHRLAFANHKDRESTYHQDDVCAVLSDLNANSRHNRLSSVPELLDMIDQAADEIHVDAGRISDYYGNARDHTDTDHESSSSELFDDVPTPGVLQGYDLRDNRSIVRPLQRQSPRYEATPQLQQVAVPTLTKAGESHFAKPPASATSKAQPDNAVPSLITTEPTMSFTDPGATPAAPETKPDIPTGAVPQPSVPEIPPLSYGTELSDMPTLADITTPEIPKLEPDHHHHGYNPFHSFLNPFHHHKPKADSTPVMPAASSPVTALGCNATPQPQTTSTPLDTPVTPQPPPAVSTVAKPYHHAPGTPPDLSFAQYADEGVKQQQQHIKAAMRMGKERTAQEASAVERDGRRGRVWRRGGREGA